MPLFESVTAVRTDRASRSPVARAIRQWLAAALLLVATAQTAAAQPATLVYNNREIVELRVPILARSPADRVAAAVAVIDEIVAADPYARASAQTIQGVTVVALGGRQVFIILAQDADELKGETVEQKTAAALSRLQTAFDEAVELRTPARLARGLAAAAVATLVFVVLLVLLLRGHRLASHRLELAAERQLQTLARGNLELVRATRAIDLLRRGITLLSLFVAALLTYSWLTFTLRRFPYSRPWGESLRGFLLQLFENFALSVVHAIPGIFTVALIFLMTRLAARPLSLLFDAVEDQRIVIPWIYPETVQSTRRIVSALLWLFALVLSYPYLPGSDSEAFKGVSVFVGLVISLGSSGIVNQVMSGLTLTYSRALRLGDFVRIGEVEGMVTHIGTLSTKVKTLRREEVTIPNAVVVSNTTTNFSRYAASEGVLAPTAVTIGYDTPWRQVHALLLLAAARTAQVRPQPAPAVRQTKLQDFYVEYTLLVSIDPMQRVPTLDALHRNIQDAFNEYGVQIMSPNYEADPTAPKFVPRDQWFAAPATPEAESIAGADERGSADGRMGA